MKYFYPVSSLLVYLSTKGHRMLDRQKLNFKKSNAKALFKQSILLLPKLVRKLQIHLKIVPIVPILMKRVKHPHHPRSHIMWMTNIKL